MIRKILPAFVIAVMLLALCACQNGSGQSTPPATPAQSEASAAAPSSSSAPAPLPDTAGSDTPATASGEVTITFNYIKQSGSASNQFAVWIEDMDGNLIRTLYATRFTVNGGYKNRPDSISLWVEKSELAAMSKDEIDAVTGATPKAGDLSYSWDLTDANGNAVAPGQYKFFVERTLRWKNRVLYSGVIDIGDAPVTVDAVPEFTFEAAEKQPALSEASPESSMLGAVTASFQPSVAD